MMMMIAFIQRYSLLLGRLTALFDACDAKCVTCFFKYPLKWWTQLQHCLVVTWLVPWEAAAISACSVYTKLKPCTMSRHFVQHHICRVHACLAVTCHLHFWQNDWDLLHAIAVTQGWNGYWNKSQHRKLTTEKKSVLPLLPGLKPMTFWSQVRYSNHWAKPGSKFKEALCYWIFALLIYCPLSLSPHL